MTNLDLATAQEQMDWMCREYHRSGIPIARQRYLTDEIHRLWNKTRGKLKLVDGMGNYIEGEKAEEMINYIIGRKDGLGKPWGSD